MQLTTERITSLPGRIGDVMNQENLVTNLCNTHDLGNLVKWPTCFNGENPTSIDVILSNVWLTEVDKIRQRLHV